MNKAARNFGTSFANIVSDILNRLEALEQAQAKTPEPEPAKVPWHPKMGQMVWSLGRDGSIASMLFDGGGFMTQCLEQGNLAPYTDEGKAWLELQAKLRAHICKQQSELRDAKIVWVMNPNGIDHLVREHQLLSLNTRPCYATQAEAQAAYDSGIWSGLWRSRSW